ncbi:M3 family metallopeptidase [Wenzhouxiangella marina]|uniref:Uncharacterized protein n=1 Tax=Wenzhouxiangella marina TaxID=1579979 RepID=A0A0K0XTQ0_9GAMM|nr:M3 family metallopeptidase [Wenzhouxiangella marina]AKS41089.1 hypothetical protein WM2015_708 [Wenzhouxiangella marina]MBB6087968.1 thimet oligopeptidase [Wenzhouxiangella marina]
MRTSLRAAFSLLLLLVPSLALPFSDPGPVWQGITDTTSLGHRIDAHLADAEQLLADIRALEGPRSADNTLLPYKRARHELGKAKQMTHLALNTHPEASFREYARGRDAELAERWSALALDRGLYDALAAIDTEPLSDQLRYVLEHELQRFRRDGIELDEEGRNRARELRARIAELGARFEENIRNDNRSVTVSADALAGLPPDLSAALAASPTDTDGNLIIAATPDIAGPAIIFAERADVREQFARALLQRGYPANVPVIDSIRALRHELATLLGFRSWADYSLSSKMAASPERVAAFIEEVADASEATAMRELDALLAYRRRHEPDADSIPFFDQQHWTFRMQQEDHAYDALSMRPYFPYAAVRDGILEAYGEMFRLEFRRSPGAATWADATETYEVWDDERLVGRFTLDMHPREGKFGHFAAFPLRMGGGEVPEAALVCNFPGGSPGDPGLLDMGQVATFFHEFGHLIHMMAGGRVDVAADFEADFVEAPSQLLEAWARDYDVLSRFARHHETGAVIPRELVAAYREADAFGRAGMARQNLWLAALALDLHLTPPDQVATADVEGRVAHYLPIQAPEWLHPASSVQHLYGYSSNYYTYLWSEVIAQDLLTAFDENDRLDPVMGRRYFEDILAATGTAPSAVLIERFLGRPFNAEAWRHWLRGE